MPRQFYTLDVFTNKRHAGNPLAVVLEAEGLGDAEMQAIATEFNLSETVFVFEPRDPVNTAAVRIFTPGSELPFAGHPTIGTAILLAHLRAPEAAKGAGGLVVALEEKIGLVRAEVSNRPAFGARAIFEIPKAAEPLAGDLDATLLAKALGVEADDIGFKRHQPAIWSAGVPFAIVPVKSLAIMERVGVVDLAAWRRAFGATGHGSAFIYSEQTIDPVHHVHARVFAPGLGVGEDPATGAAVAAFSGHVVAAEAPPDGQHQLVIEQGYEMGRPSEIALDLDIHDGRLVSTRIGGAAVIISRGELL